ncbi:VTT domain-containing protein [Candidatus Woesebacteria bacterium]|nr:MAG: VTT domain-containing protein [Candidatus Woesebacteria bacterium]
MNSIATHPVEFLEVIYITHGYFIVFISNYIEASPLGWAIPGGVLVALGGFFAQSNILSLGGVLIAGWLGLFSVLLTAYYLGSKSGMRLAKILHQEKNAAKAKRLIEKHGATVLTTSLLASLTRFWVAYVCGAQKYSRNKFIIYAAFTSFAWNFILVFVGYVAGEEKERLDSNLAALGFLGWIILFVTVAIIYWYVSRENETEK